jgi:hypothetical protein
MSKAKTGIIGVAAPVVASSVAEPVTAFESGLASLVLNKGADSSVTLIETLIATPVATTLPVPLLISPVPVVATETIPSYVPDAVVRGIETLSVISAGLFSFVWPVEDDSVTNLEISADFAKVKDKPASLFVETWNVFSAEPPFGSSKLKVAGLAPIATAQADEKSDNVSMKNAKKEKKGFIFSPQLPLPSMCLYKFR